MNRNRYPLILNPNARSEKGKRALAFIMKNAAKFVIYATRDEAEAEELSRDFAAKKAPVVVAAGGDGTLNAALRGLIGSETAMGIMPTGTMNVFAREMGVPTDQLDEALRVIEDGFIKNVDIFTLNGAPFLQMAGVGFDAHVIEETSRENKKFFGPLAYLASAIKVLGEKPPRMTVTCEGGEIIEGVCLLVGNGSLYGGQFSLFQEAANDDDLLDAVIFKEAGYRFMLDSLGGLARGGVGKNFPSDSVAYVQVAGLKVACEEALPVEIDGELWGRSKEICFAPSEHKLRVLAPRVPTKNRWSEMLKALSPWG